MTSNQHLSDNPHLVQNVSHISQDLSQSNPAEYESIANEQLVPNEQPDPNEQPVPNKQPNEILDVPYSEAIRDIRTYLVGAVVGMSVIQGSYISLIFKNYGLENISSDQFITIVGTIGSVSNGLSRSFWGNLIDVFPYKIVFGTLLAIQVVIGFTMELVVTSKPLYMIWI
jgi:hypothetical protein